MAAKTSSTSPDFPHRFWATLSFACGELCLIVLLHVAALASYAAARLAGVCRLKAPCILCSRLDHGKPWFSADSVCVAHRSEVASLAYCKGHGRLARSQDFCNDCLACAGSLDCPTEDVMNSQSWMRSGRLSCSCCSEPFKNARGANQTDAPGNAFVLTPMVVSEQVPADHTTDKSFVVGIEEVSESDGSPGRDEHSVKENGAASATTATANPASTTTTTRSAAPSRIYVDRNSSVKNAFIGRLNLPSPRPSEIIFARDNNSTTQREVQELLSQISSARGLDRSPTERTPSPGVVVQPDESNAMGRRPSLERSYSVLEPSDGNLVDDREGESSVENLKKQLELSKKSSAAFYKELEEERNASAVAASQTMAMINRLQEEKAAMQMEALQYLRMMEEQADHDHEAIQNLHDLLTDREKELLDLDAELASCRRLIQNEPLDAGRFDDAGAMNGTDFGSTMTYFEDERAYIYESLRRLEENLCVSTSRLASDDASNSQEDAMLEDHTMAHGRYMGNPELDDQDSSSMGQEHTDGDEMTSVQQYDGNERSISSLENYKMSDGSSVKNAILLLNTRLKALEVDQKFLKKVLSSLASGSDELQCVQEVTNHLAELQRVVTQRRAMALPLVHTIWS